MATNRPTVRTVTDLPGPLPLVDLTAATRLTTDLVAQAGRLWLDLWFTNLHRASAVFWDSVRAQDRRR